MLGRPQHIATESSLMATKTDGYTEGCARKNISLSTQRTDYGLRAVKTYDNTKRRAGHEKILGRQ